MGLGISLLISCYNRTGIFQRSYPTWFEGKTWPDEVCVLNDGGDRGLEAVVEEMANRYLALPVSYIYRHKESNEWSNPAVAHNYLVKTAEFPIVLIIDPEIAFVTDGLPVIKKFYSDEANRSSSCSACRTYGIQDPDRCLGWSVEQIINNPSTTTDVTNRDSKDVIFYPCTPASGYRAWWRQRYIDLGGKDERYLGWGYEDLDLHFRQTRLPPIGRDACLDEIAIVRFAHGISDMSKASISFEVWKNEGEKGIPVDGVANRDREWGMPEIEEEYQWA